jgi:DNA-binding GntR family transcriptional regulator
VIMAGAEKVSGTGEAESVVARILRPRSLTAIVIDQIRDLIITGKLALGEQLSENTLAEQLGVSRTPVREAFLRLESEGLVEVRPQRGTFVFQYDATELREILELREVLEAGALRIGLGRDAAALAAALDVHVKSGEEVLKLGPADYQAVDTAFHETLVGAANNSELLDAYIRIASRVRAIRYRNTRTIEQITSSQDSHRAIVAAIVSGDHAEAESLLRHHVYTSYRIFLERVSREEAEARTSGGAGEGET